MKYTPNQEFNFRRRTHNSQAQMAGVTVPTFQCKNCREFKKAAGRKRRDYGFICESCANSEKESNDVENLYRGSSI